MAADRRQFTCETRLSVNGPRRGIAGSRHCVGLQVTRVNEYLPIAGRAVVDTESMVATLGLRLLSASLEDV